MNMYDKARECLIDHFRDSDNNERGLKLYEILQLMKEHGVDDRDIAFAALDDLFDQGLIAYGRRTKIPIDKVSKNFGYYLKI